MNSFGQKSAFNVFGSPSNNNNNNSQFQANNLIKNAANSFFSTNLNSNANNNPFGSPRKMTNNPFASGSSNSNASSVAQAPMFANNNLNANANNPVMNELNSLPAQYINKINLMSFNKVVPVKTQNPKVDNKHLVKSITLQPINPKGQAHLCKKQIGILLKYRQLIQQVNTNSAGNSNNVFGSSSPTTSSFGFGISNQNNPTQNQNNPFFSNNNNQANKFPQFSTTNNANALFSNSPPQNTSNPFQTNAGSSPFQSTSPNVFGNQTANNNSSSNLGFSFNAAFNQNKNNSFFNTSNNTNNNNNNNNSNNSFGNTSFFQTNNNNNSNFSFGIGNMNNNNNGGMNQPLANAISAQIYNSMNSNMGNMNQPLNNAVSAQLYNSMNPGMNLNTNTMNQPLNNTQLFNNVQQSPQTGIFAPPNSNSISLFPMGNPSSSNPLVSTSASLAQSLIPNLSNPYLAQPNPTASSDPNYLHYQLSNLLANNMINNPQQSFQNNFVNALLNSDMYRAMANAKSMQPPTSTQRLFKFGDQDDPVRDTRNQINQINTTRKSIQAYRVPYVYGDDGYRNRNRDSISQNQYTQLSKISKNPQKNSVLLSQKSPLQQFQSHYNNFTRSLNQQLHPSQLDLPLVPSGYVLLPHRHQLRSLTRTQLRYVSKVSIQSQFGKIYFHQPISLFRKNIQQLVQIKQDWIQIQDQQWEGVRNFGNYNGNDKSNPDNQNNNNENKEEQQKEADRRKAKIRRKIAKWVQKNKMGKWSLDQKTGDLTVQVFS